MDYRESLLVATRKLRALRDELDEVERRAREPIAILSFACRLPGGVDDPERLWALLRDGGEVIEPFPAERWDAAALYDADPDAAGRTYCTRGGFVRGVDQFDPALFGIAPREAASMDPAQRLALECVWEGLERARLRPGDPAQARTGVFLGGVGSDYEPWGGRLGMSGMDGYGFTGRDGSVLSGRVSFTFGFGGPALTVNTACSSSLVALDLACRALRAEEVDLAVSGGSQIMTTPGAFVEFSRLRGAAPDGRCKSFSDAADGVGWAEGCAILVLQRLSDARRDGHRILAVVRGTAVNHDGRSQGLTAPSGPAQERVIRQALDHSGLTPDDIDLVEGHGTGTALGDPVELGALGAVFGPGRPAERPLYLGSAKSNLGHTQAASGTVGVIKLILGLAHHTMPRTLHAERPNRRVAWADSGLAVLDHARPWPPGDRVRRAGVSSFGIGGTNAHVIVEEAPREAEAEPDNDVPRTARPVPLVLSGADPAALRDQALRLADALEGPAPPDPVDVAWSLATTRTHFAARVGLRVPADAAPAAIAASLRAFVRGEPPAGLFTDQVAPRPGRLAVMFSGQGCQRPQMGRALYEAHPAFRDALDAVCAELDPHLRRPLQDVLFAPPGTELAASLDRTELTQPALFALEVALYRQWERWGVVADLVLGHSIGELAAAHVAGVLSLPDAAKLVVARGRCMAEAPSGGAMLAVRATEAQVAELLVGLEDRLGIAALNGPAQTVISGDAAAADEVAARLGALGVDVRRLRVSHAFHSPHMDGILDPLREVARTLTFRAPHLPMVSALDGTILPAAQVCSAEHWVQQVRRPVRFMDAVQGACAAGADRFLECGPRAVLSAMAAGCRVGPAAADEPEPRFVPSLTDGVAEPEALAEAAVRLHLAGTALSWPAVFDGTGARAVDLPTYAFQRRRFWLAGAGAPMPDGVAGVDRVPHPILGAALDLPDGGSLLTGRLSPTAPAWLGDHQVLGRPVVPATALLEAVLAAGRRAGAPHLRDVVFEAPLVLDGPADLQVAVDPADPQGQRAFRVHARPVAPGAAWTRHASGRLGPAAGEALAPRDEAGAPVDLSDLYARLAQRGLHYGPAFRCLRSLRRDGAHLHARVVLPAPVASDGYGVHPALLDAVFHAVMASDGADAALRVPFEVEQARLGDGDGSARELRVHVALGEGEVSVRAADPSGALVVELRRITFRPLAARPVEGVAEGALYRVQWGLRRLPAAVAGGRFVVVGAAPLAAEVADALRASGAEVDRCEPSALGAALGAGGPATVVRVLGPDPSLDPVEGALQATIRGVEELEAFVGDRAGTAHRYAVVTSGAAGPGRGMGDLAHAPLWGLIRAVRREHPDRAWLLVDTDGTQASQRALHATLTDAHEPEAALRRGSRLVPRLVPALDADEAPRRIDPDGTVVVTGGTTGIGAEIATHLARAGARHLVLVSRRGRAAPGAEDLVAALATLGCHATAVACDVADEVEVQALLEAIGPEHPLTGVFHGAAIADDALLGSVTPARVQRAFGPKVRGAYNLHRHTQHLDLPVFVLSSSIAGWVGNAGQGVYAAANTFLDALGAGRHALGLAGQAIAWGPWSSTGMAARLADRDRERMARSGLIPLAPEAALALLDRALRHPDPLLVPVHLDGAAAGRERADAPVQRGSAPQADAQALRGSAPPEPVPPPPAPQQAQSRELLAVVRAELAAVARIADPGAIPADQPFAALGMDLPMAIDLRQRLEERLGRRLPPTVVIDHPSCSALVSALLGAAQALPAAAPPEPASLSARFARAAPEDRPQLLLEVVRADVAAVLRLPDPTTIHPDRPLDQLGMDSLVAVDIRRRLEQRVEAQLPATVVFDHPSCRALSTFLLSWWDTHGARP